MKLKAGGGHLGMGTGAYLLPKFPALIALSRSDSRSNPGPTCEKIPRVRGCARAREGACARARVRARCVDDTDRPESDTKPYGERRYPIEQPPE